MAWRIAWTIQCRDWDTWWRLLLIYRPVGYWWLLVMWSQALLHMIGLSVTPRRTADRLVQLATRRLS